MTNVSKLQAKEKIIGALLVSMGIILNFLFMGLPVIFLNIGLLISFLIWMGFNNVYSRKLSWLYLVGILIQSTHFAEEYFTGFYKEFPAVFTSNSWTSDQFVIFNATWIVIFLISLIGTFKRNSYSFIGLWFFIVISCIGNAILHIGLTLLRQKYFPGTVTSFLLLTAGILMIKEIKSSINKIDSQ